MITKANIFLGLNDKDSKTQIIASVDAANLVNELVAKTFGAGTITEAFGVYTHENSKDVVIEKTLKIEVLFFDKTQDAARLMVIPFCSELKRVFNQESVALQMESVNSELV